MEDAFLKKIASYISYHHLLQSDKRYLVALSGGADSVTLLLVLHKLGYAIEAVHCNFRLRGAESDRDERFCRDLCANMHVPFHVVHFDTQGYAALHHQSIELAARNLRYNYFEQLRRDIEAEAICVAHHADDSVETVLMNMMRGTGLLGLTGIKPRNGYIIRPLLCVHRKEIENWLHCVGQPYVTDSTNLHDDVTRNKIRLHLLPLMKQINGNASDNILATINHLQEATKIIEKALDEADKRVGSYSPSGILTISIDNLMREPSPEYLLYHLLMPYGFTPAQVEAIAANLHAGAGKEYRSATHWLAFSRRGLQVAPIEQQSHKAMRLPEPGTYVWNEKQRLKITIDNRSESFRPSKEAYRATLDADKVAFPLTLRHVVQGDRFVPFGMKGSKLVSDFLTDRKLSVIDKSRQLVVTDAHNNILWLIGQRTDDRYKIGHDTVRVMTLSVQAPSV